MLEVISPLSILIPIWFFLIKISSENKQVKLDNYGRKQVAIRKALSSTSKHIIVLTMLLYGKFIFNQALYDPSSDTSIASSVYFYICFSVLTIAILNFVSKYRAEVISIYRLEEKRNEGLSRSMEITQVDALSKALNAFILIFVLAIILNKIGVSAKSLMAFGGMGSIVIGFAAKDFLSDFISGLLLYADRQFFINDWVKISEHDVEGVVEFIGWRVSRIRTLDNQPIYVPNKFLGSSIIQNVTRREGMRIKEFINIDINCVHKVPAICKEIKNDVLIKHTGINTERTIIVGLNGFDGEVANIYISAHTKTSDIEGFYSIKQDIWVKIYSILQDNGVEIRAPKNLVFKTIV